MQDSEINPILDEIVEEQERDWRDEAKETFVNLQFAMDGLMKDRILRHQKFEEALRAKESGIEPDPDDEDD